MMKQQSVSSQLDMAPVIFPKPPSRDEDEGGQRSIHVLESLRRHRSLVTSILLFFFVVSAFLLWRRRNPIFTATSRIYVSPSAPKALTDAAPQIGPYDSYVEEQIKTVTRYDVLLEAIRKMPPGSYAYWGPTEAKAVGALQKTLTIVRLGESFDVEISLDGPEPHLVTDMVNMITQTYIDRERHEEFFVRDQQLATLRDQESTLQRDLAAKQTQEQGLLKELGVGSVQSNESSPYNLSLAKLHSDLTEAEEQLNASRSNLASLQSGANASGLQAAAQDVVTADQSLNGLKTSLITKRGELVQQMSGLTPSNPVYKQDDEQLKSIDAQIAKTTADVQKKAASHLIDKANADVRQKAMVVDGLQRQLLAQTQQATGNAGKYQQAQQTQADTENLQKDLAALQDRMRQLEVDSGAPGSIHLLSPAMVPVGPNKNKTVLLAIILLMFSVGASVGSAVALDYFDPHIYGADDVKQVMGFPPLGMLLDHDHFSAEVSQQYLLRLAAAVHHAVRASGARTFLFTATEPESGTTTLVEKVARQLRSLNMRTLTIAATNVDGKITYVSTTPPAEHAKDSGREMNDAQRTAGGSAGGQTLNDKLMRQQPGPLALNVHVGEPSNTMFSGSFVAQILNEHQNDYDVVLIDGGPILISADAEYLARIADGTVIVTQSGRTTRTQLRRSASLLEKLHVPGVAVVLNRITPERADAALRQDIQDFQQQLKKQRGTGLVRQTPRRIPPQERASQERPAHERPSDAQQAQAKSAHEGANGSEKEPELKGPELKTASAG